MIRLSATLPAVTRARVLAYRAAAHGLGRESTELARLGVLDLGVQDTPVGSARLALAARLDKVPDFDTDPDYTLIWSLRGAPHLYRTADLPSLARRAWPVSDADALARLANRPRITEAGIGGIEAFARAVEAMRAAVTAPTAKGTVSGAMTRGLPEGLTHWCGGCKVTHVFTDLFLQAGLFAMVGISNDTSPPTCVPLDGWQGVPQRSDGSGKLISTYLTFNGPATPADAAGFLGTTRAVTQSQWPDGLAEVAVEGRRAWLPESRLDALRTAPPPPRLRLLPPSDPFLQARDRSLLLPDRSLHKVLWRAIGGPGAVLVDGDVAGTWRGRKRGKSGLEITIEPFTPLPSHVRDELRAEAERVAAARGLASVQVTGAGG
jgi:hypothetical protein